MKGARSRAFQPRNVGEGCLYDPHRWCEEADISRSELYRLWKRGQGPYYEMFGCKRRITESPREYLQRKARERRAAAGDDPGVHPSQPQIAAARGDVASGSSTQIGPSSDTEEPAPAPAWKRK
jgi:hypothetical protein